MSQSKYHKEEMVNIGSEKVPRLIPRKRAITTLSEVKSDNGTPLVVGRTGVYIKDKSGAIISTKTKISKKERREQRRASNVT